MTESCEAGADPVTGFDTCIPLLCSTCCFLMCFLTTVLPVDLAGPVEAFFLLGQPLCVDAGQAISIHQSFSRTNLDPGFGWRVQRSRFWCHCDGCTGDRIDVHLWRQNIIGLFSRELFLILFVISLAG